MVAEVFELTATLESIFDSAITTKLHSWIA